VAKLLVDAGLIVLVAVISPFEADRQRAKSLFEEGEFLEIFVDTPVEVCVDRDPKGLYKKANKGEIPNFTGVGQGYETPRNPDLHLRGDADLDENVDQLLKLLF
jgi:bifunctional enzyme CysN/CysC